MKILKARFNVIDAQVEPFFITPVVSDDIQQTLSRLLGWDRNSQLWRLVETDVDGRLLVSTDATKVSVGTNSAVSVGVASTAILAANNTRRYFVLYNNGTVPIAIEYDTTAVLATGLLIPVGGMYSDDGYVGAISGIASVAAQDVRVLEV
jgi:hypothetical protein